MRLQIINVFFLNAWESMILFLFYFKRAYNWVGLLFSKTFELNVPITTTIVQKLCKKKAAKTKKHLESDGFSRVQIKKIFFPR